MSSDSDYHPSDDAEEQSKDDNDEEEPISQPDSEGYTTGVTSGSDDGDVFEEGADPVAMLAQIGQGGGADLFAMQPIMLMLESKRSHRRRQASDADTAVPPSAGLRVGFMMCACRWSDMQAQWPFVHWFTIAGTRGKCIAR
jgi:hypothetical protein